MLLKVRTKILGFPPYNSTYWIRKDHWDNKNYDQIALCNKAGKAYHYAENGNVTVRPKGRNGSNVISIPRDKIIFVEV